MSFFRPDGLCIQMGASGPHTVAFAIRGPIVRTDLPGLCKRVCALLSESRADVVLCDVTGIDPDAVTVDALIRLQLAARRYGCEVRLCRASEDLLELVAFMGLEDVCPADATTDEFSIRPPSTEWTPTHEEDVVASNASRKMFVNLPVADLRKSVGEVVWMNPSALEQ